MFRLALGLVILFCASSRATADSYKTLSCNDLGFAEYIWPKIVGVDSGPARELEFIANESQDVTLERSNSGSYYLEEGPYGCTRIPIMKTSKIVNLTNCAISVPYDDDGVSVVGGYRTVILDKVWKRTHIVDGKREERTHQVGMKIIYKLAPVYFTRNGERHERTYEREQDAVKLAAFTLQGFSYCHGKVACEIFEMPRARAEAPEERRQEPPVRQEPRREQRQEPPQIKVPPKLQEQEVRPPAVPNPTPGPEERELQLVPPARPKPGAQIRPRNVPMPSPENGLRNNRDYENIVPPFDDVKPAN